MHVKRRKTKEGYQKKGQSVRILTYNKQYTIQKKVNKEIKHTKIYTVHPNLVTSIGKYRRIVLSNVKITTTLC
jgi:hypothetical protein